MFLEMMLSAALLAAVQAPALPEIPLSTEAVLPPDVYLVKAHALTAALGRDRPVDDVKIGEGRGAQSFEIDHVYVGPADLKGKTFFAELWYYKLVGMMVHRVEVPVAKGQPGIWWIKKEKGEFVSVYREMSTWFTEGRYPPEDSIAPHFEGMVFAPAWRDGSKVGDARYEMAVARAEVFEKIYHAADKDRLKLIDDYVRSHDSIKGAAALMLLLRGNNPIMISKDTSLPLRDRYRVDKFPKIADYVLPFSKDESLSPRVQWEVEQLLLLNKHGWKDSPEEWKMFERWFNGTWKEKDNVPWQASEEKVLVEFFSTRPLSTARRLELAVGGLANASRSDRFKAEILPPRQYYPIYPKLYPKEAQEAFTFLVRTIRKDAAPARKVAAAKLLAAFAPLSAEHRATIEGLRQQKLGDEVTKEITRALAEK